MLRGSAGSEVYARAAFEMDLSGNSPKHKPKINFESAAGCITGNGDAGQTKNDTDLKSFFVFSSESRGLGDRSRPTS